VSFLEDEVFREDYIKVHPQTRKFVKRFGLDFRLFERDVPAVGSTRTFSQAFAPKEVASKDANEIDLDDI